MCDVGMSRYGLKVEINGPRGWTEGGALRTESAEKKLEGNLWRGKIVEKMKIRVSSNRKNFGFLGLVA